jgi:hypothetical protein
MTVETENPVQCFNTATGPKLSNEKELNLQPPQPRHGVKRHLLVTSANGVTCKISTSTRLADVFLRLANAGHKGITALDLPQGHRLGASIHRFRTLGIKVETSRHLSPGDPFRAVLAMYRIAPGYTWEAV